jgi:hypothetical protein
VGRRRKKETSPGGAQENQTSKLRPHPIAELLDGKRVEYPRFAADTTFKKAPKASKAAEEQMPLGGEMEEPF